MKHRQILLLNIFILFLASCSKPDCNEVKKAFLADEYNMVVLSVEINNTWIKLHGFSLLTNKNESIMVHNNWKIDSLAIQSGDTIVKKKSYLPIIVHTANSIVTYEWFCNGKIYN